MKAVLITLIVYLSSTSAFALAKITESEAKLCLASLYAAELAVKMEETYYSENMDLLGLDKQCAHMISKLEIVGNDEFSASVVMEDGKIWTINERKELKRFSTPKKL
jgi:hypothetical protein